MGYSTLVVSPTDKFGDALSAILDESVFAPVDTASSPAEARAVARERAYDLLFINAPPEHDASLNLAADASEAGAVVFMLLSEESYESVRAYARSLGIFAMKRPVSVQMIAQAADFMCAAAERLRRERKTAETVERHIADINLINRAKWLLIDNLKMTEDDAHRYIERQAMDRCLPKRDIAESIIKTYKTI